MTQVEDAEDLQIDSLVKAFQREEKEEPDVKEEEVEIEIKKDIKMEDG